MESHKLYSAQLRVSFHVQIYSTINLTTLIFYVVFIW